MLTLKEFLSKKFNLGEPILEFTRDYKKEYKKYHSSPTAIKNRGKRVTARRRLERAGRVHKGDGKDVDHKQALSNGGGNSTKNLRVVSKHVNRGKDNN
jgi:hypothetical protein